MEGAEHTPATAGFTSPCPVRDSLHHSPRANLGRTALRASPRSLRPWPYPRFTAIPASARGAKIRDLVNAHYNLDEQRRQFDLLRSLNKQQLKQNSPDAELESVIASYELAWRMQNHAPNILDLSAESNATLSMYGINEKETDSSLVNS